MFGNVGVGEDDDDEAADATARRRRRTRGKALLRREGGEGAIAVMREKRVGIGGGGGGEGTAQSDNQVYVTRRVYSGWEKGEAKRLLLSGRSRRKPSRVGGGGWGGCREHSSHAQSASHFLFIER